MNLEIILLLILLINVDKFSVVSRVHVKKWVHVIYSDLDFCNLIILGLLSKTKMFLMDKVYEFAFLNSNPNYLLFILLYKLF